MEPEVIQRFLESVGQKADVDLYLKLFRAQRKESFAIIVADAQIVRAALDPFHFDLRILAGLGLNPVVLVGLLDARDADRQSQRILEWLLEDEVPARTIGSGPDLPAAIRESVRETLQQTPSPLCRWTRPRNSTSKTASVCCTAWPLAWKPAKWCFCPPAPAWSEKARPPFRWSTCPTTTND